MTERTFQSGHHRKRHHRGYRSYLLHHHRDRERTWDRPAGDRTVTRSAIWSVCPGIPREIKACTICSYVPGRYLFTGHPSGSISQGNVPEPCPATIPHRTKRTMILTQTRRTGCIRQGVHLMRSLNVGDSMRSFLYFRLTAENPLLPMKLQSGPGL